MPRYRIVVHVDRVETWEVEAATLAEAEETYEEKGENVDIDEDESEVIEAVRLP